ncbi:mechanosensitive ion channel family protein [Balneola sp. MJW-20]|uniref:mechanosensitive ion channel family protein n=1 Tax=Gracilimonas aurantiaca TaxID=3234185 RepID=UPI0034678430
MSERKYIFTVLILVITSLIATGSYAQQSQPGDPLLSTPRRAVHTFLHWQQQGHKDPAKVIKTMQLSEGDREDKMDLARQLLKVLDSRGLIINYDVIPSTPDFTDTLSGIQQYILFQELPQIYLVRSRNNWVFSEPTIQSIPEIYSDTYSALVTNILDHLPEWSQNKWLGIRIWQYLAIFTWILIGFVLRKIFEFLVSNYLKKLAAKTRISWDDEVLNSIDKPSGFIFITLFFYLSYTNLQLSVTVNYYLSSALEIAVSVGFVWLFYNLADVFSNYLVTITSKTENVLDDQLIPLIRKSLRVFVVVMGVIAILQNNGYNVASLIAGLGIGGLAVALAARETLANFFGSITIFVDRPFRIGDWIKVGDVEGTVEEVGFRSTRVRTFYNSLVSVPNSNVANTDIDNLGLRKYRRLKTMLNLTYSTSPEQMEAFVEGIKAVIRANNHFRQDYYEVHFNNFGAHSLDVLVYVFFDVPDWNTELQQKHNFYLEILRLAKELGVEFAFPTQTLHVDSFFREQTRPVGEQRSEKDLASAIKEFGPEGSKAKPDGVRIFENGKEIDYSVGK